MEAQFVEPTFASRLKVALCFVMGLGLSAAMNTWWRPFMAFVKGLAFCESLPWLRGILLAFVVLFWLAGLSVARAAVLTLRSGQSPFPGAWIWSRTKVRTGWKAKVDGYAFAFLAAICFLGPLVAAYLARVIFFTPASCS